MVTSTPDTVYHATVRELPNEERPRERLERYGAAALTNPELMAIILRVGIQGENVIELSSRLLHNYGGLGGLLGAELDVLRAERGLGAAKAITLKAALEVGRRLTLLDSTERPQILGPGDVATLLALDLGYQSQEQLRVLCLDATTFSAVVTLTRAPASNGKPYGSITLTG
jgi:DNA repair protein RadC